MACPYLQLVRHLLREWCGICRNDTNAEVRMVLCLSANNKECVATGKGWLLTKFKDLLQPGVISCELYPHHWYDGSKQAVWSCLPSRLLGLRAFQNRREVVVVDICYQFTSSQNKLILVLFWSLNEMMFLHRLSFTMWIQRGDDILKVCPQATKQDLSSCPLTFISDEQSILLSGCLIHVTPQMTLFSLRSRVLS